MRSSTASWGFRRSSRPPSSQNLPLPLQPGLGGGGKGTPVAEHDVQAPLISQGSDASRTAQAPLQDLLSMSPPAPSTSTVQDRPGSPAGSGTPGACRGRAQPLFPASSLMAPGRGLGLSASPGSLKSNDARGTGSPQFGDPVRRVSFPCVLLRSPPGGAACARPWGSCFWSSPRRRR